MPKRTRSVLHSQILTRHLQDAGLPVRFASVSQLLPADDRAHGDDPGGPLYGVVLVDLDGRVFSLQLFSPIYRKGLGLRWPHCFEPDCVHLVDDLRRYLDYMGRRFLLTEDSTVI